MIAIAALLTNRGFNHAFNAKAPCFGRDRAVWFVRATRRNRSIQHVHLFLRQLAAEQRAHAVEEGLWVSKRRHWPLLPNSAQTARPAPARSEEHTSELQSLMRISYAVFCLKKKKLPNKT